MADEPRAVAPVTIHSPLRLRTAFGLSDAVAALGLPLAVNTTAAALMGLRMDDNLEIQGFDPASTPSSGNSVAARAPVTAGAARAIKLVLADTLTHDSNVFRLPAGVDPRQALGVSGKSDTVNAATIGLSIDKDYAQQRFQLDVTESAYRYANFSFLNFNALEYHGAWHWHVTPRWSGVLNADHRVALASSADTQFSQRTQRNLRTEDSFRLSLDGSLFGGWHVLAGAFHSQLKYDQAFLPQNSSRTYGAEAGVKYESAARNALSLISRSTYGEYLARVPDAVNLIDNAFRQNDAELKLDWNLGGKSEIHGRVTWFDRRHEHFAMRDYSGLGSELNYAWTPSGKLRIDIVAKRDLASWWQAFSSYRIDDSLALAPTWQVSARTTLRARLERTHSNFRGPVFAPVGALRNDTVSSAQLGLDWSPLRSTVVEATLQRLRRSSNTAGLDFETSMATVNARLKF